MAGAKLIRNLTIESFGNGARILVRFSDGRVIARIIEDSNPLRIQESAAKIVREYLDPPRAR